MKTVKSSCRICINCGFDFQVESNKIVSFKADTGHPYSKGYCCPKGIAGIELQQGKVDRLTESLRKDSSGKFQTVDTQQAANEIGQKLKAMIDEHGPRSVALFFGTGGYHNTLGNAFSKGWLDAIGSPNLFTTMTLDQSSHWVTAGRMGRFLGGTPDIEDIDVALVAGNNPIVSHQGWPSAPMHAMNPGENFKAARDRGQKLIVVDPRTTETALRATLHLQLIPGEDATLYAGIIYLLFKHNWVNQEFCDRFVTHIDRLKQSVVDYNEDYVAQRTGVPIEQLQEAARLLGNAKSPRVGCATGTSMTPDSNLADFLLEAINALCGAYRRAGDLVRNQNVLSSVFPPVEAVYPPRRSWEKGPKCRTQDVGKIFGEFPSALLPDEILQPGKDKIRALIVYGANPAISMVDPDKTIAALKDLELLVTLDHTLTETGHLSDYVLATTPQHERHDLNGMAESIYPESYVQYFKPVVQKPDTVMHDWEVFWTMAKAMDVQLELKHMIIGVPFSAAQRAALVNMKTMPKSEDLIRDLCEHKNLDFEELKSAPRGVAPKRPEMRVKMPEEDNGAKMDVCPDDIASAISQLRARSAADSRYRLSVRRISSVMNGAYRDSDLSRRKYPINFAYMNPLDMAHEGLADGSQIDISTDSGKIIGTVRSDETIREGVVSMTHCYGSLDKSDPDGALGGHTGRLIPLDPAHSESINFMPHKTGIPINISPR